MIPLQAAKQLEAIEPRSFLEHGEKESKNQFIDNQRTTSYLTEIGKNSIQETPLNRLSPVLQSFRVSCLE